MADEFSSVADWAAECVAATKRDDDCLVLVTGEPGSGKSTLAFQLLVACDPAFSVERCAFTISDFIRLTKVHRGAALLGDEIRAGKRKAMWGDVLDLNDRLDECRAQNNVMVLNYPYESELDSRILRLRVRFKAKIVSKTPGRRLAQVFERHATEYQDADGSVKVRVRWAPRGAIRFYENAGPVWAAYRAAKRERTNEPGAELASPGGLVVSREEAVGLLRTFRRLRGGSGAEDAPVRGEFP